MNERWLTHCKKFDFNFYDLFESVESEKRLEKSFHVGSRVGTITDQQFDADISVDGSWKKVKSFL